MSAAVTALTQIQLCLQELAHAICGQILQCTNVCSSTWWEPREKGWKNPFLFSIHPAKCGPALIRSVTIPVLAVWATRLLLTSEKTNNQHQHKQYSTSIAFGKRKLGASLEQLQELGSPSQPQAMAGWPKRYLPGCHRAMLEPLASHWAGRKWCSCVWFLCKKANL